jgi:hypothetical protein
MDDLNAGKDSKYTLEGIAFSKRCSERNNLMQLEI